MRKLLTALATALLLSTQVYANESMAPDAVDINSATVEQLVELKGIGPQKSEAIVAYREQHGGFNSIEEIVLVPGIGEKIYLDNREVLTIK
ncbi:ComEA family DNA-binding protein [Aliagarivorans taiwanensis]|uniref:ComEA family DNA-binding protein n=1 Tax=Aliagarivorans taiwanensis TaxID=561966 RepID=UPI00042301C6|nr:helix-hairpin-helix domain-containing protein [Aliagarivorans taiwanensis]